MVKLWTLFSDAFKGLSRYYVIICDCSGQCVMQKTKQWVLKGSTISFIFIRFEKYNFEELYWEGLIKT